MPVVDNVVYSDVDYPIGELEPMSIGEFIYDELESNLKKHGDAPWMTDASTDKTKSFSELRSGIRKVGSALWKKGLRPGDSVLFMTGNYIEVPIAFFGVLRLAGVPNAVTLNLLPDDIVSRCNRTEPKFAFVDQPTAPKVVEALKNVTYIQEIFVFGNQPGCTSFEVLLEDDEAAFPEKLDVDPNSRAFVVYSSGTTGLPKAIQIDHNVLRKNSIFRRDHNGGDAGQIGRKFLYVNPMAIPTGLVNVIMAIFSYFHSIIMSDYTDEKFLEAIDKTKPFMVSGFPTQIVWICKHPDLSKYDLSSLRVFLSGGTSINPHYEREFYKKLPNLLYIFNSYGMTETAAVASNSTIFDRDHENRAKRYVMGSCGRLLPNCRLKILNENGEKLGPRQEGQLVYQTPSFMIGYLNNPEATAELFRDGWCHSGDRGYYDEEGNIYVTGRYKELIKWRSCIQVAPANIEKHLLTHPAIADAVVIGLPHDLEAQVPLACVVKQPGHEVSEAEIIEYIEKLVPDEERLRGGVCFFDRIPRNSIDKPDRQLLLKDVLQRKTAASA